jgi:hypothetical protein
MHYGLECLTMQNPQHLRVFLASPGDVSDERAMVRRLLKDELPYDPLLRGLVTFDVVSWDDPAAPTPMPARLSPQEAVIRFNVRPAKCDIVIVVLWSRLGTHLDLTRLCKASGEPYLSGTEWEYEDACDSPQRPEILVYWRTEEPRIGLRDPKREEKYRQYDLVEQFLGRFQNPDGSYRGSVAHFETPTMFKERLANDLKHILRERRDGTEAAMSMAETPRWAGSPYPGLRPFLAEEAAIFFGRGREVDALVARLRDPNQRFLSVVGASGTGKSSLIRAGLIPRLQDGAIEGSRSWRVLTFTPGSTGPDPFLALAVELVQSLPAQSKKPAVETAATLARTPERLSDYAGELLSSEPASSVLVLFVDQLEELFTLVSERFREPFCALLALAAGQRHLRVLATLRADFLTQAMTETKLAALLETGTIPLGSPGPSALAAMIRKPAERAWLELEDGLADEIIKDAGNDPALPLVAFCLEQMHKRAAPGHPLSSCEYDALGRLRGAVSLHADALLEKLRHSKGDAFDTVLPKIFRALVHVDAAGAVTRRRVLCSRWGDELLILELIETLVQGRLLSAENAGGQAAIMLAHEALITEWAELQDWLNDHRAQLERIQRLVTGLTSSEHEDRFHAVNALCAINPMTDEVFTALIGALRIDDVSVRCAAAYAIGEIGPAALEGTPELITALTDTSAWVRRNAAQALGKIGGTAEVIPALITALKDDYKWVRMRAAEALGQFGPLSIEAVPTLIGALEDVDADVIYNARDALKRIQS